MRSRPPPRGSFAINARLDTSKPSRATGGPTRDTGGPAGAKSAVFHFPTARPGPPGPRPLPRRRQCGHARPPAAPSPSTPAWIHPNQVGPPAPQPGTPGVWPAGNPRFLIFRRARPTARRIWDSALRAELTEGGGVAKGCCYRQECSAPLAEIGGATLWNARLYIRSWFWCCITFTLATGATSGHGVIPVPHQVMVSYRCHIRSW